MKLIMLGAPGAGKGTQAKKLEEKMSLPQVSTGDMLRRARAEGTDLGKKAAGYMDKGELVPDEVVVGITQERLLADDCVNGFILDGFPRTVAQAEALEGAGVKIDHVLSIEVPESELLGRLTGRRSCPACGAMFHVMFQPPKQEGKCDVCSADLIQRSDDNEQTVRERLQVYNTKTAPLVDFYRSRNLLREVDGSSTPATVFENLLKVVQA